MKSIYKITLILIVGVIASSKAQSIPLFDLSQNNFQNNYFEDLDFDLDNYVGTWLYQQGTISFKIVLQKKSHIYDNELNSYFDMLIGEYEYIENVITIINTLSQINDSSIGEFNHNINGYILYKNKPVIYQTDIRRVNLHFVDPLRPYIENYITLRRYNDAIQFIEMKLSGSMQIAEPGQELNIRVPGGFYIFKKQI